MENGFFIPIDAIVNVRKFLSSEQIGKMILALTAFANSEDPGEMEPAVGIAFNFLKDRIQTGHAIHKANTECRDINEFQQASLPVAADPDSSDRSQKGSDSSCAVQNTPDDNNASDGS